MGGEQDWHGGHERDEARIRRIEDALHKLMGRKPLSETRGGVTTVSLKIDEHPDRTQTQAVLRVLGYGDRFGHSRTARWERIWVEVGGPAPVSPPAG
ncbi:hypothetical protein ACFV4P_27525 [Kitasatospora sp. NPDC059795]|uniref:hypothetical protein n=1 Tax=unclassified Kitasatospora TaxID=2633591 RepID=UPI00093B871A|nr:hypothetical protein [Kitasatospora sp. CB01950]OKJ15666.1 hypothetical protein AMK19_05125 [Kitasatospora sp. CB01950]